jgi:ABC-type transport system substrate-binding protein
MPLFCAVPSSTPAPTRVTGPIPFAGPYYVRSQTARRTVLDRNPNYSGPRPRRPARIVYLTGVPTAKGVALAAAGRADVVPWDFDDHGPLAPGGSLDRRAGERYRVAPAPGVDMIGFNTKRPLFSHARLRRAVSYAIDRRALAGVWNETPVDGYVPPAIPGPRATRAYPLGGPDLEHARRLARGSAGATANLYFCGEPANARIAEIVRSNLLPLGIHVAITPSLDCLSGEDPKARSADLILVTRATSELDPAPFLDAAVGDTFAIGSAPAPVTWDGAGFRDRLERANLLPEDERLAAYARIEDDMLRTAAPYAAFGSFVAPELRSARVGCTLIQGAYHVIDLGALCLRAAG